MFLELRPALLADVVPLDADQLGIAFAARRGRLTRGYFASGMCLRCLAESTTDGFSEHGIAAFDLARSGTLADLRRSCF